MNSREVRETQVDPVAGIWICQHCGRRIQVITDSDYPKLQGFICVCTTPMLPGEEHAGPATSDDRVVDG
jgi:hypothetical protein